jgi:molybdate transport system permease protein
LEHAFGWELPFTIWAAILAETFVAMPFFVITVEGALRSIDTRFEDAASTLGAGRFTVMRRVTLPAIGPSIAAGLALTWARALGEFGATVTFAGSFQGRTQTLPLAIYLAFENGDDAGIVLSLVLVAVSVLVLAVVGSRVFASRARVAAVAA